MTPEAIVFDAQGLVPAVVQEADTGEVLMVAWMDRVALDATLRTGQSHFWSRSRQRLWRKGESSGHVQHVQAIYADCDADTLLVQVHQEGVACHTGQRTCFFTRVAAGLANVIEVVGRDNVVESGGAAAGMLGRLEAIVAARKAARPAGSYVVSLLDRGEATVCRKIGEEAVEVVTAALGGEGDRRVVEEIADLWFHTIVLLGARGIPLRDVLEELARRHAGRDGSGAAGASSGSGQGGNGPDTRGCVGGSG